MRTITMPRVQFDAIINLAVINFQVLAIIPLGDILENDSNALDKAIKLADPILVRCMAMDLAKNMNHRIDLAHDLGARWSEFTALINRLFDEAETMKHAQIVITDEMLCAQQHIIAAMGPV